MSDLEFKEGNLYKLIKACYCKEGGYHSIGDEVICHKQCFNSVFWIKDWTPPPSPPPPNKKNHGSASGVHLTDCRKRIILYKSFVANLLDCDFCTTLMLHTCDTECFIFDQIFSYCSAEMPQYIKVIFSPPSHQVAEFFVDFWFACTFAWKISTNPMLWQSHSTKDLLWCCSRVSRVWDWVSLLLVYRQFLWWRESASKPLWSLPIMQRL